MNRAFFMARQPVKTPGAKEAPKAEVKATTTAQASTDDALDAVLGKPETTETNKTAEDALAEIPSGEGPVEADALVPVEQLDAVAQKLAEAEAKIKALEAQSKAQVKTDAPAQPIQSQAEVKRAQNVLTDRGWDSVED